MLFSSLVPVAVYRELLCGSSGVVYCYGGRHSTAANSQYSTWQMIFWLQLSFGSSCGDSLAWVGQQLVGCCLCEPRMICGIIVSL